jgi:hypothetical protein
VIAKAKFYVLRFPLVINSTLVLDFVSVTELRFGYFRGLVRLYVLLLGSPRNFETLEKVKFGAGNVYFIDGIPSKVRNVGGGLNLTSRAGETPGVLSKEPAGQSG